MPHSIPVYTEADVRAVLEPNLLSTILTGQAVAKVTPLL